MPTDEQWKTLVRVVKKKFKSYDESIEDLWKEVRADFDSEVTMVDEAMEIIHRQRRELKRLTKRVEELESGNQETEK